MPPLSVVIITLNEERNIGRCIESVLEVADDIVVLDSLSSDATEQIATSYPKVRFFKNKFPGHIEQKNLAVAKALYPHVLSLDADEALSPKLRQSILEKKQNWDRDGYYMNRLTWYIGTWIRHCGWYPDRKLRLWDSRKGHWGGINPHDKYLLDPGTVTGHLKGDLLHYSFYSIEQHLEQIRKFADIKARMMLKAGRKSSMAKVFFAPGYNFFRQYFLRLGFLDGFYGFVVSLNGGYYSFLTYFKLWMLARDQEGPPSHPTT